MCFDQTQMWSAESEQRTKQFALEESMRRMKARWNKPHLVKVNGEWRCQGQGVIGVCVLHPGWAALSQQQQQWIAHRMWERMVIGKQVL